MTSKTLGVNEVALVAVGRTVHEDNSIAQLARWPPATSTSLEARMRHMLWIGVTKRMNFSVGDGEICAALLELRPLHLGGRQG